MGFTPGTLTEKLLSDKLDLGELANFRFDTLMGSILKKYVAPGDEISLSREALAKFAAINDEVANFKIDARFLRTTFFGQWKHLIHQSFYCDEFQTTPLSLPNCLERGRVGPGASIGCKDQTFYTKMFDSPLTTTSESLKRFYRATISGTWAAGEFVRNAVHGDEIVEGSRMTTVPKNKESHRTICVEPTLNMFYQLGAKSIIEDILVKVHGFSRDRQQDINKDMAREGSLYGNFATLDLKNASDSISLDLCRNLLPTQIFQLLDNIRSRRTLIGDKWHTLGMISTMGNGFTFPLMTLIFTCMIKALIQISDEQNKRFAVFGDDLIVPSSIASRVILCLKKSGFAVNVDKSFVSGPFRESCGGDFYKGHDVRGIYLKEMQNEAHVYSLFNRLHFWSCRHGIPLINTLRWLQGLAKFRPVPCHASFDSGFIVTTDQLTSPKRTRTGGWYYSPLEPIARKVSADGLYNHSGALTSLLGGYIRNRQMLLPNQKPRYRPQKRTTPAWDSFLTVNFNADGSKHRVGVFRVSEHPAGLTSRDLSSSWEVILVTSQVR